MISLPGISRPAQSEALPAAAFLLYRLAFLLLRGIHLCAQLLLLLWHPRGQRIARTAVILRAFLESMGFTYIKFGQFLAFRFDLLPQIVCDELGRLFDDARPLAFETVRRVVEAELRAPLAACFASFDRAPLAAASLAQVHHAVSLDGERLAIKIQRPEARSALEADIRIGRVFAWLIDCFGLLGVLSAAEFLHEFEDFTRRETDFLIEAHVATRLRLECIRNEYVPAVRWDLTTTCVLAEEYIEGTRLTDIVAEDEGLPKGATAPADIKRDKVIATIAKACLKHVFVDGYFHADPHPGNILVRRDGSVAFVDFGIFGELTEKQRRHCSGYMRGLASGDYEDSFHHYYRLLIPTPATNKVAFKQEMIRMMRDWRTTSMAGYGDLVDRHLGTLMLRTTGLLRKYSIRIDTDLLLFYRLLYILDSLALSLDRQADVVGLIREFFEEHRNSFPRCPVAEPGAPSDAADALLRVLACDRPTILWRTVGRQSDASRKKKRQVLTIALAIVMVSVSVLALSH
ncbi:ABC1 kinase family protein [Bradyrhizobium sp. SZCCHNRI1009]|uniref:ABC1 kinase family protein n=1 Tax=Bradyrhizobium sp. SZCCHNRI1009 TaxID=3057277 RepID=UPI0029164330|nr:AarF/UbiB family protein [Bradyrhizobium sp. SZCCHNRI1009]